MCKNILDQVKYTKEVIFVSVKNPKMFRIYELPSKMRVNCYVFSAMHCKILSI